MQKIVPHLWFESQAEEAATFYVSLFKDSRLGRVVPYPEEAAAMSGRESGSVMTVEFQIEGQDFIALNGGPMFTFSEAISFLVNCEDQAEIDRLWRALTDGGEEQPCGWLKDRFGLSWQIVPRQLDELMAGPDAEGAKRAVSALFQMKKIEIAQLEAAYKGA